jgi:hypothetical protein
VTAAAAGAPAALILRIINLWTQGRSMGAAANAMLILFGPVTRLTF